MPVEGGGRGTPGSHSPKVAFGLEVACVPGGAGVRGAQPGEGGGGGRRRPQRGAQGSSRSRSTVGRRARNVAAAESYPADLKYHREHDWARVDGDEAVLGITWFAQDALGELVHFEPPEEGATIARDEPYGEIE